MKKAIFAALAVLTAAPAFAADVYFSTHRTDGAGVTYWYGANNHVEAQSCNAADIEQAIIFLLQQDRQYIDFQYFATNKKITATNGDHLAKVVFERHGTPFEINAHTCQ